MWYKAPIYFAIYQVLEPPPSTQQLLLSKILILAIELQHTKSEFPDLSPNMSDSDSFSKRGPLVEAKPCQWLAKDFWRGAALTSHDAITKACTAPLVAILGSNIFRHSGMANMS